jgi:CspA family cold shock protein
MYIIIKMSFSDPVETNTPGTSSAERMTGRVKWFNNKSGYGFITITDGPRSGGDIFVHHSAVQVSSQQYKYLVQGEYVEFKLNATEGGAHDVQAADVSGIKGGKLMCETRREFRIARSSHTGPSENGDDVEPVRVPRSARVPYEEESKTPRVRGSGPRDGGDWQVVKPTRERAAGPGPGRGSGGRGTTAGRGRGRPRSTPEAKKD